MSTDASRRDADDPGADAAPPLAADRPYVDGTAASPEELRAEVERLSQEERFHVDDLREELGDSVAELASRLDVKGRMSIKNFLPLSSGLRKSSQVLGTFSGAIMSLL